MSLARAFRNPFKVTFELSVPPSAETRLLKLCSRLLRVESEVVDEVEAAVVESEVAVELPVLLDSEEVSFAMRLCRSVSGFGRVAAPIAAVLLELVESESLCCVEDVALCACIAANRLCRKPCSACAESVDEDPEEVVEPEEEDVDVDDDEPDSHELPLEDDVLLVLESPVTPICDRACRMESIRPPPGGGGGGIPEVSVPATVGSAELVCVLLVVELVELSCVSQELMFEMLLMVT
jgi:hypothetical protein